MKFLLYDIIKRSSTRWPNSVRTPELADSFTPTNYGAFNLPQGYVNCIGLAARDAWAVYIYDSDFSEPIREVNFGTPLSKGLYTFPRLKIPEDGILFIGVFTPIFKEEENEDGNNVRVVDKLEFSTIQRLALGEYIDAPISPQRTIVTKSTSKKKMTLSGQMVTEYKGYSYTTLEVEIKYRIDDFFLDQLEKHYAIANASDSFAYGDNEPIFCDFLGEKLPFSRFYGTMQSKFMLQSAVRDKLYSVKMKLTEAF